MHLVTNGLASSREKAQRLIRAGEVRDINGNVLDKPGKEVSKEIKLKITSRPRFVSRGGEKLLGALQELPVKVRGRICLDAGISTGGFTDCLLQHGAAFVYGIDVGYGQIAWNLRQDSRVILKERTNIRKLTPGELYCSESIFPSLAVADLSFISLGLVLPAIKSLLEKNHSEALILIKPQFEVGRERVGKGGVVRDRLAHVEAIQSVIVSAIKNNWYPMGLVASPLTGPAGNHEYFLWLGKESRISFEDIETVVSRTIG